MVNSTNAALKLFRSSGYEGKESYEKYMESNKKEILAEHTPNKPFYIYNDDQNIEKSKRIGQNLIGKTFVLPADKIYKYNKNIRKDFFEDVQQTGAFVKRISVLVNEMLVDTMIISQNPEGLQGGNPLWFIYAGPNAMPLEVQNNNRVPAHGYIFFNYPGVGCSEGSVTEQNAVAAHRAMLALLEDETNGFGAKVIVSWGASIGGGVQGEAIKNHVFKDDIDYFFVKEDTFLRIF
jgi:hypothetical protein